MTTERLLCYCDSGQLFSNCCQSVVSGETAAGSAEALMRSRYSAYCLGCEAYLLDSWHTDTRPSRITINPEQQWLGLKIVSTQAGNTTDDAGTVEFIARYKLAGSGHRLHETSRFLRVETQWYYLNGEHHN